MSNTAPQNHDLFYDPPSRTKQFSHRSALCLSLNL